MKTSVTYLTLIDEIVQKRGLLWNIVFVFSFACLTALCAQVSFWIGPVPVSGQTFAVLLSGALLGSRRGALSQLSYLAIGATGVPFWFALGGTPGAARLISPTGGFLFGFIAVAFIIGRFSEKGWDRHIGTTIVAMLAGEVFLYLFGLTWLSLFIPRGSLLQTGFYPFIIGDVIKILLAASLLPAGWLLLRKFNG
jgi:biotin transporter BioY